MATTGTAAHPQQRPRPSTPQEMSLLARHSRPAALVVLMAAYLAGGQLTHSKRALASATNRSMRSIAYGMERAHAEGWIITVDDRRPSTRQLTSAGHSTLLAEIEQADAALAAHGTTREQLAEALTEGREGRR